MMKCVSEQKKAFREGMYDARLLQLYEQPAQADAQRCRYIKALESFEERYGDLPVRIFSAPGRSEICGNHTDHQLGKVLAASISRDIIAVAALSGDDTVLWESEGYPPISMSLADLSVREEEKETTSALIRGVAKGLSDAGYRIGGVKVYSTSEVLSGSGLSSSAAFEVVCGNLFAGLCDPEKPADPVLIAKIGQMAENLYFGKPSGLMDQMACSFGGMIHIDFSDPEDPVISPVAADFSSFAHQLCIVDTRGSHAGLTDEYAKIPGEMKLVASYFGKEVLRHIPERDFYEAIPQLRQAFGDRPVLRAMHFYQEDTRVNALKTALEAGDFSLFKEIVTESGRSSWQYLQNVTVAGNTSGQNLAVALAVSGYCLKEDGAWRVHGGGFAGTIQAFVPNERAEDYRSALEKVFGEGSCHFLYVRTIGGCCVV